MCSMPSHPAPTPAVAGPDAAAVDVTRGELIRRLEVVVLDTPGVASLVPSMSSALNRLRLRALPRAKPSVQGDGPEGDARYEQPNLTGDGISLKLRSDAVTATFDITVAASASALATAVAVRRAASRVLETTHPGRHIVLVNVLGREPSTTTET